MALPARARYWRGLVTPAVLASREASAMGINWWRGKTPHRAPLPVRARTAYERFLGVPGGNSPASCISDQSSAVLTSCSAARRLRYSTASVALPEADESDEEEVTAG